MMGSTEVLAKAQRMISLIDRRIDLVRVQRSGLKDESSCVDHERAWNAVPGLQGFDRSLHARRGDWQRVRDSELAKIEKHAEAEERRRIAATKPKCCPTCGQTIRQNARRGSRQ